MDRHNTYKKLFFFFYLLLFLLVIIIIIVYFAPCQEREVKTVGVVRTKTKRKNVNWCSRKTDKVRVVSRNKSKVPLKLLRVTFNFFFFLCIKTLLKHSNYVLCRGYHWIITFRWEYTLVYVKKKFRLLVF